MIEVTDQGGDTAFTQHRSPIRAGGQGKEAQTSSLELGHAQADIAAADDQETFAAKPGGQGAEGTLV